MPEDAKRTSWAAMRGEWASEPGFEAGYDVVALRYQVGSTVRAAREAAGLSQANLAEKAGTTQPEISRLELGGSEPRLSTLIRLAKVLGPMIVSEGGVQMGGRLSASVAPELGVPSGGRPPACALPEGNHGQAIPQGERRSRRDPRHASAGGRRGRGRGSRRVARSGRPPLPASAGRDSDDR